MCTSHAKMMADMPPIQQLAPELLKVKRKSLIFLYLRPAVTLALYIWLLSEGWYWLTVPLTLMHFGFALGLSHELIHGGAGVGRRGTDGMLFITSLLLIESSHGFRLSHIHHHSHTGDEKDVEIEGAARGFWGAIAMGPICVLEQLRWGLKHSHKLPQQRRWILLETGIAVALWLAMWPMLFWLPELGWYILMMWLISWIKPFLFSYLLHANYEMKVDRIGTSVRGWFIEQVAFGQSYHMEHHLYPQVPTCHLPALAKRLEPWMGANAHIHQFV